MKQWLVAHTQPTKEEVARLNLLRQNFEVYIPRYKRLRRHARRVDTVLAPLFPRYLFINLDIQKDRWRSINGTKGICYLLLSEEKPALIPSTIIDQLKNQEDSEGVVSVATLYLFVKGQKVNINDGFFSGYTATFEKMADNDRVRLLLNFLGQEQELNVPLDAVESA
jgi:transcriptional antiterminator RfaH